mgnify:FL=1
MGKKILCILLLTITCMLSACAFEKEVDYTEITDDEKAYFTSINLDEKYVYSTLNDQEKYYYRKMLKCLMNYEESVMIRSIDYNVMERAYKAIRRDYGGIFWVDGYDYATTKNSTVFTPSYSMTKEKKDWYAQQIADDVDKVISQLNGNDYEKVKALYEYLVKNVQYNESVENGQNILSVFLDNETVCNGYASATQYVLNLVNVESIIMTGYSGNEKHAWNYVRIDNKWYQMDVTYGATSDRVEGIDYLYMTMTDDVCNMNHLADDVYTPPVCDSMEANYFVREGTYFKSTQLGELSDYITSQWMNKSPEIIFVTDCDVTSDYVKENILTDENIVKLCDGIHTMRYEFSEAYNLFAVYLE